MAFGKQGLDVEIPDSHRIRVLEAKSAAAAADSAVALAEALDNPIGSPPLAEMARGKASAAISVCDITRPAPNRLVLPPVLERLAAAGIPTDAVTVLIATGLHRPASEAEIREIVGPELYGRLRVANHHAKELGEHRYLGETKSGTPIHIDRRFLDADLHITLGFIEPHLMLGFSGGRKLIAPGLAAQETIKIIHSPKFMRDPRAVEGSVDENPLQRELLEVARMARHDFMVDVALTRDRRIAGVFAGAPEAAHAAGMKFVGNTLRESIDQPMDLVITTAAGYPLDLTYYQTVKGITAASHIAKPGGRILVLSECEEGAGAPEFCEMMRRFNSHRAFLDAVASAPVTVDQWQLEKLALVCENAELLYYVPGLPAEFHELVWGRSFRSPEEAIAAAFEGLPERAQVAVIPEGPYVLASVEEPVPA